MPDKSCIRLAIFNNRAVAAYVAAAAAYIFKSTPGMLYVTSSMHFDDKFAFFVADPCTK